MNLDFITIIFKSDTNILLNDEIQNEYCIADQKMEYFYEIGEDRLVTKPRDYSNFGKIYIRSSTKILEIERVYLKLTGFLANTTSILSKILVVLYFTITYFNNFKAE